MLLGTKVGLVPGHIVLDGDQAPPPKKRHNTHHPIFNFRLMSVVAKRHGRIKMTFSTQVGFGPCDIVLDWDGAPSKKGHSPQFLAHVYCGEMAG